MLLIIDNIIVIIDYTLLFIVYLNGENTWLDEFVKKSREWDLPDRGLMLRRAKIFKQEIREEHVISSRVLLSFLDILYS